MRADQHAVSVFTLNVVEKILRGRDVAFHAQNLGDVRYPTRPVWQTLGLEQ